jgi:rhodanese-related sulfurtransferase
VALQLREYGILRAVPLTGGFEGWLRAGYPTDPVETVLETEQR